MQQFQADCTSAALQEAGLVEHVGLLMGTEGGGGNACELAPCGTQGSVISPVRQQRSTVLCSRGGGKRMRREEEEKKNGRIK